MQKQIVLILFFFFGNTSNSGTIGKSEQYVDSVVLSPGLPLAVHEKVIEQEEDPFLNVSR